MLYTLQLGVFKSNFWFWYNVVGKTYFRIANFVSLGRVMRP